jgi:hypothetical protein
VFFTSCDIVIVLAGIPALAQTASEGTRVRVAGTIEELKGDVLTIGATHGQKQSVTLSPASSVVIAIQNFEKCGFILEYEEKQCSIRSAYGSCGGHAR